MGDDETESSAVFEECQLRALRGLPLPGKGTHSEPIELDAPMNPPESPRELRERNEPGASEPPEPIHGGPVQGQGVSERIPLRSVALHVHRSHGHYPYDVNCESCCSSKGRVPARRLRRNLQKEDQTIGIDFFYFGKLRVLLMVHCSSRYTISLPAMELSDPNLMYNIDRAIREMGLVGKMVTIRCDQESSLIALAEKLARNRKGGAASGIIVDVVPGYRPQAKGAVERQVETMRQGFWAVWLDLEKEIAKLLPPPEAEAPPYKMPLGGLLWQAALFYSSRCFNLWSTSLGDVTTPIDRLHEEFVHRTRTLPFGCTIQAKVGGSAEHVRKYRGAKTIRAVYLGPVHPRGGGVFAARAGSTEIDIFPACRAILERDMPTYDPESIGVLSAAQRLTVDPDDPERPILFEAPPEPPVDSGVEPAPLPQGTVEDEEMIPAEDPLSDIPSYVEPTDDEGEGVGDLEPPPGGFDGDMEIDWLTDHLMAKLMSGPDCRAASSEAASSFELAFGGKRIKCRVPRDAVSETSGEKLDPALLYASMKLELEELESFKVGEIVSGV